MFTHVALNKNSSERQQCQRPTTLGLLIEEDLNNGNILSSQSIPETSLMICRLFILLIILPQECSD